MNWTAADLARKGYAAPKQPAVKYVRGKMNGTERDYDAYLGILQRIGEIQRYGFESVTFKLAKDMRYTPDFYVLLPDGTLSFRDVKGRKQVTRADGTKRDKAYSREDSRLKIRMAAERYPEFDWRFVFPLPGGDWGEEVFGG